MVGGTMGGGVLHEPPTTVHADSHEALMWAQIQQQDASARAAGGGGGGVGVSGSGDTPQAGSPPLASHDPSLGPPNTALGGGRLAGPSLGPSLSGTEFAMGDKPPFPAEGAGAGNGPAAEGAPPVASLLGGLNMDDDDDGGDLWVALGQEQAMFQEDVAPPTFQNFGGFSGGGGSIW